MRSINIKSQGFLVASMLAFALLTCLPAFTASALPQNNPFALAVNCASDLIKGFQADVQSHTTAIKALGTQMQSLDPASLGLSEDSIQADFEAAKNKLKDQVNTLSAAFQTRVNNFKSSLAACFGRTLSP